MLLTLTYASAPATDLGYLLRKSPQRVHEFELTFGKAQVFYPEAELERQPALTAADQLSHLVIAYPVVFVVVQDGDEHV